MIVKKMLIILMVLCFPMSFVWAIGTTPIRILIVPGHDSEIWGAQYGKTKEADMTLALATKLFETLKKDHKYKVFITRDKNGYIKEFQDYFDKNGQAIISFRENAKNKTKTEIATGNFIVKEGVPHINAKEAVSIKLFGINKWADENKIDMVLHVHFNDYPRKAKWTIGKYKGIAVYVPDSQMANAKDSKSVAENIFQELMTKYIKSTYPKEKAGVIEDQNLIALGASGTLNAGVRSVLVEYGYIYGKIFRQYKTRQKAYQNMADLTAKGIEKYFN